MDLLIKFKLGILSILTIPTFKKKFIYLFLDGLCLHFQEGFSLVAASGGYFLAVMCWLLIAITSLVAEHRL